MNQSKKHLARLTAFMLVAGMSVPYALPGGMNVKETTVMAEDSAVAPSTVDEFVLNPTDKSYCTPIFDADGKNSFNMDGRLYHQGILLGDGRTNATSEITYDISGIKELEFNYGHIDNTGDITRGLTSKITVLLDGLKYDEWEIKASDAMHERYKIENKSGASELKFVRTDDYYSICAIADITVDGVASSFKTGGTEYKSVSHFINSGYNLSRTAPFDKAAVWMNGRQYLQGIILGDGSSFAGTEIMFNVETIDDLSFVLGHIDGSEAKDSIDITFWLDGESKVYSLRKGELAKEITLDLTGVRTLRISKPDYRSQYAVADIKSKSFPSEDNTVITPVHKDLAGLLDGAYDKYNATVHNGEGSSYFQMSGRTYYDGFVLQMDNFGVSSEVSLNVEDINKLTFDLGHVDNTVPANAVIEIRPDNAAIPPIELNYSTLVQRKTIDVSNAKIVRFTLKTYGIANSAEAKYAIGDIVADGYNPAYTHIIQDNSSVKEFISSVYDDNYSEPSDYIKINGVEPAQGLFLGDGTIFNRDVQAAFNVENLDKVSFKVGAVEGFKNYNATLAVYIDGVKKDEVNLTSDMALTSLSYDVKDATRLDLRVPDKTGETVYGVVDFEITAKPASEPVSEPIVSPSPSVSPSPTAPAYSVKDINGDGKTTPADARMILKAVIKTLELTEEQMQAADANGDGKLDSLDAVLYLKSVVGAE